MPHPLNDPTEFGSLVDLHGISRKEGYSNLKNHIVYHYCNSILVMYISKCSWLTRYEGLYYIKSLCSWCNNIFVQFRTRSVSA